MLVIGLIVIEHMQSVIKVFFFFKNYYYFSDLETQWPRNRKLKWDFAFQYSDIRGGMSQYWRTFNFWFTKKSQLCFRASVSFLAIFI